MEDSLFDIERSFYAGAGKYVEFPLDVGQAYQGDIGVFLVDSIDDKALGVSPTDERHIVGHSETGHHHWASAKNVTMYGSGSPTVCYLQVHGDFVDLQHDRPTYPHKTIRLPGNGRTYKIVRQQEWTPEGWRVVAD